MSIRDYISPVKAHKLVWAFALLFVGLKLLTLVGTISLPSLEYLQMNGYTLSYIPLALAVIFLFKKTERLFAIAFFILMLGNVIEDLIYSEQVLDPNGNWFVVYKLGYNEYILFAITIIVCLVYWFWTGRSKQVFNEKTILLSIATLIVFFSRQAEVANWSFIKPLLQSIKDGIFADVPITLPSILYFYGDVLAVFLVTFLIAKHSYRETKIITAGVCAIATVNLMDEFFIDPLHIGKPEVYVIGYIVFIVLVYSLKNKYEHKARIVNKVDAVNNMVHIGISAVLLYSIWMIFLN